jgi:hypothetical protein
MHVRSAMHVAADLAKRTLCCTQQPAIGSARTGSQAGKWWCCVDSIVGTSMDMYQLLTASYLPHACLCLHIEFKSPTSITTCLTHSAPCRCGTPWQSAVSPST